MRTFKDTKQAEQKLKKLFEELEIKTDDIRIKQWTWNKKAYFIDMDISGISLYGLQCISELLGDTNPTITPTTDISITIGSIFKIE